MVMLEYMTENGGLIHASNKRDGIKHSSNAKYRSIVAVRRFTDDIKEGTSGKSSTNSNTDSNIPQGVVKESGDGYNEKYTSSAGIIYTHYKQFQGSYAETPYWGGTIHHSGCGPTSIAIISSGLTNNNYTPKDIASHMSMTSYETLKAEMDSIGLQSEVIHHPSAQQIQDNLKNGKVMLVSVNGNTQFTSGSHIMAIVDIDTSGKVYICNPGSSTKYGWYDINEITKGCNYIVVTDAKVPAGAQSGETSNYSVEIATWSQVDTTVKSNDPEGENSKNTQYTMTTTNIDYKSMVQQYTMPFDYLWAYLVIGEEKDLAFDLADLVYNSDIQITIHDNLTVDTDIDVKHYTEHIKAIVDANVSASCSCGGTHSEHLKNDVHDPHSEKEYTTTTTVITKTNTVDIALTRANVWIVDYKNEYTYSEPSTTINNSTSTEPDTKYGSSPSSTGDSYSCEHVNQAKASAVMGINHSTDGNMGNPIMHNISMNENIKVKYYKKYVNNHHDLTNKVETTKYTPGTPEQKEKTDEETAPNFVTVYNDKDNRYAKNRINDVTDWLFEIIETNPSTSNMLDLTKYLLYKATGNDYGRTEFDFSAFYPSQLNSVGNIGANGYVVHTEKSSPSIVINDVEKLKRAFKGYSRSEKLVEHAQEYLDYQNKYKVNAVFAAAVAIDETTAGTRGHAVDGKNNWYNIKTGSGGGYKSYSSPGESIKHFYETIANGSYYFRQNKFDVHDIGMTYCENADAPGGWIENVNAFMTQMYNAAGVNLTQNSANNSSGNTGTTNSETTNLSATGKAGEFLAKLEEYSQIAKKEAPSWKYGFVTTKNTFEMARRGSKKLTCVVLPNWALKGINILDKNMFVNTGNNSLHYKNGAEARIKRYATVKRVNKKEKTLVNSGELKPGDICCYCGSRPHTNVYAGNKKWYDTGPSKKNRAPGYSHSNHHFKTFGPISRRFK